MAKRPIWEALTRLVEDLEDDRREFLYMKPSKQGAIDPEFLPFSQQQLASANPEQLWHHKNVLRHELKTANPKDKERIELAMRTLDQAQKKASQTKAEPDLSGKADEPGGGLQQRTGIKGGFRASHDKGPDKSTFKAYQSPPDTKWTKPANQDSMRIYNDEVRAYVDAMSDMNTKSQFQDALTKFERSGATLEQWSKLLDLAKKQVDAQHQRRQAKAAPKPQTVPGSTGYMSNKRGEFRGNYPGMRSGYRRF
jgi:hypothetical protein